MRNLSPMLGFRLFALAWALASPAAAALASDIDHIVAVVNDDIIMASELNERLVDIRRQLAKQKITEPPEDVIRKQVLERLIVERLQLQMAAQMGIRVDDARLQQALERIAQNHRQSVDQLLADMAREGLPPERFRQQIREQLTVQQLLDREINGRIVVTDSEVASALAAAGKDDAEYNVSHILVAIPEAATADSIESARRRAQKLLDQLRAGANFEQLAVGNSQGPNALEGGGLGWRKTGQLPDLFVNALKSMTPGTVTDLLRSPNGFHILRLNDRRGGSAPAAVTQTHARHILVRVTEIVSPDEARRKLQALRERIVQGDDFAALARANSDDTGSAANGGDLGWVNPGQLVPDFERAMAELKDGDISQPVRTPYGYHLIQVLARRQQDVTEERNQASARQQIHARKAEERYDQWLRQLRAEAYVEIRP